MPLSLPKISIGISTDKAHFDKTHDVNTTSDFGFCQPTLFDEVPAQTKISLQTHSKVLMGVLPQQSFARIQMQSFCNYVPVKDVFLAYDYMMTNQTVQSALRSYVPTTANWLSFGQLFHCLFFGAQMVGRAFRNGAEPLFMSAGWLLNDSTKKMEPYAFTDSERNRLYEQMFGTFVHDDLAYQNLKYKEHLDWFFGNREVQIPYLEPSFNNADFTFALDSHNKKFITWHLTKTGKRIMKVIYGLGYDFGATTEKASINPILAYYKTWFDKFQPSRSIQWKATKCYYLIHAYYDDPSVLNVTIATNSNTDYSHEQYEAFIELLYDLASCCYTLPVDYLTCCTDSPVQGSTENATFTAITSDTGEENVYVNSFEYPSVSSADNSIMMRWMQKLLPRINKNSVIGARVDKLMQSRFGQSLPASYMFGEDKVDCYIDPILSNADTASLTAGSHLGERAGQSSTNHSSGKHSFTCDKEGYIIQLTYIVPFGGYSQGINPHVSRTSQYDFYDRVFDGLGVEPVPVHQFYGASHAWQAINFRKDAVTFGFRPRLMDYKYKNNVRLGDFKNNSTSPYLMGYNSDRFFTEKNYHHTDGDDIVSTDVSFDFVNGDYLRFIGRDPQLGNYDRIFLDTLGVNDNFIIQMIQEYHIYSPMLPISESYDTYDGTGLKDDNASTSIGHA